MAYVSVLRANMDNLERRKKTDAVKTKPGPAVVSLQVTSKEVNKFHLAYVSVLRANMDNLERRKKTDAVKTKPVPKKPSKP
ncbi:unnamed protein product [Heligmosomoides polygyrus]|uniref:Signal recognition particle 14 kDa protein n=1 Tax=Heligmosomoides polygyrus TaxID=6339 RepID=A0A3P7V9Y0_HELPZ|nr:unnamed protein product [Heligmosomoides polygyrus]